MAEGEVYRIEIPIEVKDNTEPALTRIRQKFTKFEQATDRTKKQVDRMNRTRWQLMLSAVDRASPVIRRVSGQATSLVNRTYRITLRAVDLATAPIRAVGRMATSTLGLLGAGAGVFGGIVWPIQLADNLETARIGFETMLGSAREADAFLREIQEFAIETPFGQADLIQRAQNLLTRGFARNEIIPMLQRIGNVTAAMGTGDEGIERIVRALGQMRSLGRVTAEDMNQLIDAGVQGWKYLAEGTGMSMAEIRKQTEKGAFEAERAIELILKGMEEFDGMMDKTANRTLTGLLSQIMDTFNINVFTRWGQGLSAEAIPGLRRIRDWFDRNRRVVEQWGDTLEEAGQIVGRWVIGKVEDLQRTMKTLVNSEEWQKAETFGEKLQVALDQLGAEEALGRITEDLIGGLEKLIPQATDVAIRIGGAIASGITQGLWKAAKEDPLTAAAIGGFLAVGVPGPWQLKLAVGGAFTGAALSARGLEEAGRFLPGSKFFTGDRLKELQETERWLEQLEKQTPPGQPLIPGGSIEAPAHAMGGIFSRPHFGLVAESGPESIIPLTPSPRSLGLWAQTGRMLGVGGGNSVVVESGAVSITVQGSVTEEGARVLSEDIADELADRIGRKLEMVYGNLPAS